MQYTCYYKKKPFTKVHNIIMFIYQNKCSSSMIELHGTSGFTTSVIRFKHHACRASVIYSEHQGTSTQMVVCYVGQYEVKSLKFSLSSFICLGVNYCIYNVYCNTQLLIFRFSFLHVT